MSALCSELFANGVRDGRIDDDSLFRRADRTVVEALSREDVLYRLWQIGRSLYKDRNITGPDPKGRLPGRVSRPYESNTARGENHGGLLVFHEGFGAFDCGGAHAPDCVGRHPLFDSRLANDSGRFVYATRGGRVRRKDYRISRLDCDQTLE